MRGPRTPAPVVGYSAKIYYCQQAGAVGIVFVDYENSFARVPMFAEGPIFPGGPVLKVRYCVCVCVCVCVERE